MALCCLVDNLEQGRGSTCRVEGISPAPHLRAAALRDLVLTHGQPGEERIDVRTDRGRSAAARVSRDVGTHPGPDVLVSARVGAVRLSVD